MRTLSIIESLAVWLPILALIVAILALFGGR